MLSRFNELQSPILQFTSSSLPLHLSVSPESHFLPAEVTHSRCGSRSTYFLFIS